ncbi:MAG: phosphoribosylformylglycinamidine synthase subunit PurS [Sediminibacterium sp.]|jgi:phosphoribosylformylglycinamidine synthase PurS subunit|nr:phosphoribosylformylglycinamidine synthase subunit PurS [Chitinophagaceae bacterium]MCE2974359.1 phosphoribosylformylglycinamidine synthase subunit PurS [Sediminibacterium sp.]MCA6466386.1 phosphoribosylformylglycinamidine synthase subunit PurS [Chitinophagaceae bacterium]MCA6472986.1 phosphoribosylformylglycinamidine synthase subunit PurS [Chitinophagaceae bacterium]MCA6476414.1 phosphoribosylformylglycinamidine synthase subunit PurS [Chitinophagaceae bacterium]
MTFQVQIKVMPLKDLLDPQGKAVMNGLHQLGIHGIQDVRVGKHISLSVEAATESDALALAKQAAEQLLANPVMEFFEVSLAD